MTTQGIHKEVKGAGQESAASQRGRYWQSSFGGKDKCCCCSRMGKPQFETNPKHSHFLLTYSNMTSNKDHKPKVNMFAQTE